MKRSREFLWLGIVVCTIAVGMWAFRPALPDADPSPKRQGVTEHEPDSHPFDRVTAQYGPGFSSWRPWKVKIDGKGNVRHFDGRGKPPSMSPRLSSDQIARLSDEIVKQDFFTIAPNFETHWTDNPTLVLTVQAGGKTHEVSVYGPSHLTKRPMVKRFLHVWAAVLRVVPSPNQPDGDSPEMWLHAASTNQDD